MTNANETSKSVPGVPQVSRATGQVERDGKLPWDADCDATKAGLERLMRALLLVRGHFTDSFSLAPIDKPARVSVFLRVWIPVGRDVEFATLAGINPLVAPPVAHLNCGGHGMGISEPYEDERDAP